MVQPAERESLVLVHRLLFDHHGVLIERAFALDATLLVVVVIGRQYTVQIWFNKNKRDNISQERSKENE